MDSIISNAHHHVTCIQVNYADTDKMGFVHHSNYLRYCETARWEYFKSIGIPYQEIEAQGVFLPVIQTKAKYHIPALYDQKLEVHTNIREISGTRIQFYFQIFNASTSLIHECKVTVASINCETLKPVRLPYHLTDMLQSHLVTQTK